MFKKGEALYYRCRNCAFVSSKQEKNPNLTSRMTDYEAAYLEYLADSPGDQERFTLLLNWLTGFGSMEGKRILDVGAGSGKFVRFLQEKGLCAYGLEPATPLYNEFLAGDDVFFCEFLENFSEETIGGSVDTLVAWDVIEHVERPAVFLESVSRVLKPGGLLFLSTPDVGSFLARVAGKRWHHYNRYHLSLFSRKTITAVAVQYGFRAVGFARLPRLNSLSYITQYLNDFLFGSMRLNLPVPARELVIPVNLYDVMHTAFERV